MSRTNRPQEKTARRDSGPPGSATAVDDGSLAPVHRDLLLALDRMLTTGSYYPPGHAQYAAVADQCTAALAAARGDRPALVIEVTEEGLVIEDSVALRDSRCARRLYELLEPLNQALLEISADVTAEEIHEALATLRQHHKLLSGKLAYQEIEIEGLPAAVTATSRSLYVRTKAGNGPQKTESPINEYFDPNTIPDAALVPTPEGQMLEREFLSVIQGIMKSGDPTRLQALMEADDSEVSVILGTWVPDFAIKTIKEVLDALEKTNSDPMMLQHLISHAQTALDLTGDPALVELVFEKLRKESRAKPKSRKLLEKRPKPAKKPVKFTLSRAELRGLIDEVQAESETVPGQDDLPAPATADCLGICIQILHVAPSEQLALGIGSTLRQILASPNLPELDLRVIRDALIAAISGAKPEATDLIVTMVDTPLRHTHRDLLGPLWLEVWRGLGNTKARERAWPYIVNELLMGLTWQDAAQKLALYQALSEISVGERVDFLVKLESLQALQEKILAKDLFHAPAPLLYDVHKVLLASSLTEQHGPLMHQRLAYQKGHPLASTLLEGFGSYTNAHRKAYQALLDQGVAERVTPELRETAVRHLKGSVKRLPEERREEPWVADAIRWLGRLGGESARSTIRKILNEKKMLVFPVWPAACREAARDALNGRGETKERNRLGDDK